jgi:hypothetical protein
LTRIFQKVTHTEDKTLYFYIIAAMRLQEIIDDLKQIGEVCAAAGRRCHMALAAACRGSVDDPG